MKRFVLACLGGLAVWVIVVTAINYVLRLTLPGYHAAERTLDFTLEMKWARLLMAIATSLVAGAVTRKISPTGPLAPWIVGGVVLAMFLPVHISIWSRFPIWYHLAFLLTIVPSVLVGALIVKRSSVLSPRLRVSPYKS
jgi:hypothetical protein